MKTEYEISTRLLFWGDALDPVDFAARMHLDDSYCDMKSKGEKILKPDGQDSGGVAKTGRLLYDNGKRFPQHRRNPSAQFAGVTEVLRRASALLENWSDVEQSELQVFLYYKDKIGGDVDFVMPPEVLELLTQLGIGLRFTILP